MNLAFLFDNEADRAVVTASSAAAGLPAENLLDPQRSLVWRSTNGASQVLDITLASDGDPVQTFALVDHNLTLAGTLQLQGWTDAIAGSTLAFDETLQPYPPVYGYGGQAYGIGLYGGYEGSILGLSPADAIAVLRPIALLLLDPAVTVCYSRVTLSDGGLPYYQAGRLYRAPAGRRP